MHDQIIEFIETVLGWDLPDTAIADALQFGVPDLAGG